MNQNIQKMFINYYIYGLFKILYKLELTVFLLFNLYIGRFDVIKIFLLYFVMCSPLVSLILYAKVSTAN